MKLCLVCKREKEEQERQWRLEYEAKNAKKMIQDQARELLRIEIEKLHQHYLKKEDYLLSLSHREFEDEIVRLFRKLGYVVKQTPYSNDGGRDAVAVKDGLTYSIECKHYGREKTVGRPHLQKFFAAMSDDRAQKGFFVTTGCFSNPAIVYAEKNNIELINLEKLVSLMQQAFPEARGTEVLRLMCEECGDIVVFDIGTTLSEKRCQNGHGIRNRFFNTSVQELRESVAKPSYKRFSSSGSKRRLKSESF